jgi:dTDP-glucose pyrophosphorylase
MGSKVRKPLPLNFRANLRDAISHIQAHDERICLITSEDGTLVGTITDGDIRRALLRGAVLEDSVLSAVNSSPITISQSTVESGKVSNLADVNYLVVVDEKNVPVGLIQASELREIKDVPVILMAGGLGTRLLPLTEVTPKPLIEIGGRPIIEILISNLADQGFGNIYVSIRHLGDKIEARLGDGSKLGVDIKYFREDIPLGTAGALNLAKEYLHTSFLVANSDLVTSCDFSAMVNFHSDSNAVATVGLRQYFHQIPFGVIKMKDSRIVALEEKPMIKEYVAAGIYCFEPSVLDLVPGHSYLDMPELLSVLAKRFDRRVIGFPIHETWDDVGQISDLERVRANWEKRQK